MKVKSYEGVAISQVMVGIITDPVVCARVASLWTREGLFSDPDCNLIASWCVRYMKKYGRPPGRNINYLFAEWASSKGIDEDKAKRIDQKLSDMTTVAKRGKINTEEVFDTAEKIFNRTRLERAWEDAQDNLGRGDVNEALTKMQGIVRVRLADDNLIKPTQDFLPWRAAFTEEQERPLIPYPSALEEFFGTAMCRDNLIGFTAPDKSFKSFFMLDAAFRGAKAKRRVAFFEAGDLSQSQVMRRMGERAARRPRSSGDWNVPVSVSVQGKVESVLRTASDPMSPREAFRAFQEACGGRVGDYFRLTCYPNSSLTVGMVESILRDWDRTGWVADVVVIDYADILAPPPGVKETLDQIDATWRHLRRISQERRCLVLTATQTNAEAYRTKSPVLKKQHFSGRKTKLAHVTGMLGINVTEQGRADSVSGLNWIVRREGAYSEASVKIVAGCMAIANPIIKVCTERARVADVVNQRSGRYNKPAE